MTEQQLKDILAKGENEWIEFKENNYKPHLIGEYLSALSNSAFLNDQNYGYLIFGVDDKTKQIVGTNFNPDSVKVKQQELKNWLSINLRPRVNFEFFELYVEGKKVVIIQVEAARGRPVSFDGEEYIRIGSYKKRLYEHPEKERLIWTKSQGISFELQISKSDLSVIEVLSLLNFAAFFDLLKIPVPSEPQGIIDRLKEENFVQVQTNGKIAITNLGALVLANSLDDFEALARKYVRVITYKGKNNQKALSDVVFNQGYAIAFSKIIEFILSQVSLTEEYNVSRIDNYKYPKIAIREVMANALIHQDFSLSGTNVNIEIFEDRIEFYNPGVPLINVDRFIDHPPVSRNEKLASFFRRIGYVEERGTGIDKVILSIEKQLLPAPNFIKGDLYTKVTLYQQKTFKSLSKTDKVRATYQHCCLRFINNEPMTNASLRERFGLNKNSYPVISRIIKETIQAGLIKESDENSRLYIPYWA